MKTTLTPEMIEAACIAYWPDDWEGFSERAKLPVRKEMETVLSAALSTLPIAVEGKVKALEWEVVGRLCGWATPAVGVSYAIQEFSWSDNPFQLTIREADQGKTKTLFFKKLDAAKAAAQTDYKTRILSALISSPGKDGGQEVDLRKPLQMCVDILKSNGFGVASVVDVAERALAASSQPASTAQAVAWGCFDGDYLFATYTDSKSAEEMGREHEGCHVAPLYATPPAPKQEPIARSEFEAWAKWFALDVKRNEEGAYTNWPTQAAWHSWVAARNDPYTRST